MTREEFKNKLTTAGSKYDGHTTNGSIEAQMQVVEEFINWDETGEHWRNQPDGGYSE